ncbi:CDP-alcohol phosphatidyltransferase family protein [Cochlodiniinecator piscidefendens]|uniref:CDP-alcohol phosphatidyltransferase family protein n=1 Tax=Cochlodiniinecator piscidefendens TaxID=2715756 RepID=UPI001407B821|nr:CDP-alcohol phosphatidyltransferase family protein [Cochlodiniinecator piscidefendens]
MFDARIRTYIDPPLNRIGAVIAARGITANQMTGFGLILGLVSAALIACGLPALALIPLLFSRVADGLDGAVARASTRTDFGGYFDIVADFLFYGAVPMAFVWMNPSLNGAAGAFLLTSFYFNGASFLGYAILAEKHKMQTEKRGLKSLYFTGGLLEGAETIGFFVALCVFPNWFVPLAWGFGTLCFVTATSRVLLAHRVFGAITTSTTKE